VHIRMQVKRTEFHNTALFTQFHFIVDMLRS
jgi:hypothetical protein